MADLVAALGIEKRVQPFAGTNAEMVAARGANVEILFEIGAVQHRFAGRALGPETFGHGLAVGGARPLYARG